MGRTDRRLSLINKVSTVVLSFLVFTPSPNAEGFSYGPLFGPSSSGFFGDDAAVEGLEQLDRDSLTAGLFLRHSFARKFFFQSEITYIRKGEKYRMRISGFQLDTKLDMDYVQWAILGGWVFAPKFVLRPNLIIGPYVSFLTGAKATPPGAGPPGSPGLETAEIKDLIHNPDLGLISGLGLSFPSRKFDVQVDLRVYMGIRNVFLADGITGIEPHIFNGSGVLMLGLAFGPRRSKKDLGTGTGDEPEEDPGPPILEQEVNRRGELEFRLVRPGDKKIMSNPWEKTPELRVAQAKASQGTFKISLPEELIKEGVREWSVEVVDAQGKVIRTVRHEPGEAQQIVWQQGRAVDKSGEREQELKYRFKILTEDGKVRQIVRPVMTVSESSMFDFSGHAVPGLQQVRFRFGSGSAQKVGEARVAIVDKDSGTKLRTFVFKDELPGSLSWDGRDDLGKPVPGGREYQVIAEFISEEGIRQVVEQSILPVRARVTGLRGNELEVRTSAVRFNYNEAVISHLEAAKLRKVAEMVKARRDIRLVVEGHTDNLGSDNYNRKLAENRARAVLRFLIENEKVPPAQVAGRPLGRAQPVASNLTDMGRAENRRVELVMTMPVRTSGLDRVQARRMIETAVKAPGIQQGETVALMPFPGKEGGMALAESLGRFFIDRGLKVIPSEALACKTLDCWLDRGRLMAADWVLCAVESETSAGKHLVLELVHVTTGQTLVSETAIIEIGKRLDSILLDRLKKIRVLRP